MRKIVSKNVRREPSLKTLRCSAAILATAAMAGCATPFQGTDPASYRDFANSVLARTVAKDLHAVTYNARSVDRGVREMDSVAATRPATDSLPRQTLDSHVIIPARVRRVHTGKLHVQLIRHIRATARIGQRTSALNLPERRVYLSLQGAIARALRHSLAIKIEAYAPGIRDAQITQAQSAFDAVIFGSSQFARTKEPSPFSAASFSGAATSLPGVTQQDTFNNQIGVRKLLSSGATAQIGVGDNYLDSRNQPNGFLPLINPSHTADINLTVTQPLLRGFGGLVSKANIYLAQRDQRIALAQFRHRVISQVSKVEQAYYQLCATYSALKIQKRLLEETESTQDRLIQRMQIDASSVTVSQGLAAVEQRKADLIVAQTDLRNASDQLKSLINDPSLDLRSNLLLIPTDKPLDVPIAFNIAQCVETALRQRSVLQEDRQTIQRADIEISVARNNLLPKANLTFSVQTTGLAKDGSFTGAFNRTVNGLSYIDYSAGISFSIPLGNRLAEGQLEQRGLERSQALTQMLSDAQNVILQVKNQLRALMSSYQQIRARDSARRAYAQELNGLEIQQGAGTKLSPTFLQLKLDAQQSLANAELSEVQALVNYNNALVLLQQAQGTLLDFDHIAIAPAPLGEPRYEGRIRFLGKSYPTKMHKK